MACCVLSASCVANLLGSGIGHSFSLRTRDQTLKDFAENQRLEALVRLGTKARLPAVAGWKIGPIITKSNEAVHAWRVR
jgi:hypothetical protein